MEGAQPFPGQPGSNQQRAVVGVAGQQRRLHDDGLQRHTGEFFRHHGAQIDKVSERAGYPGELALFEGLINRPQVVVLCLGFGLRVRAGPAIAIDLGRYSLTAVSKIDDDVVDVVLRLGGMADQAHILEFNMVRV